MAVMLDGSPCKMERCCCACASTLSAMGEDAVRDGDGSGGEAWENEMTGLAFKAASLLRPALLGTVMRICVSGVVLWNDVLRCYESRRSTKSTSPCYC